MGRGFSYRRRVLCPLWDLAGPLHAGQQDHSDGRVHPGDPLVPIDRQGRMQRHRSRRPAHPNGLRAWLLVRPSGGPGILGKRPLHPVVAWGALGPGRPRPDLGLSSSDAGRLLEAHHGGGRSSHRVPGRLLGMALSSQSPVSDDRGPLVIRPSWASLGRWEMHVAPFLAIAVGLGTAKLYGRHPQLTTLMLTAGALGIMAACYAVYIAAYMQGTSITVTSDEIRVTHWFRSTAVVSLREVARVVRCSVRYNDEMGKPAVLAFSSTGRCVISLYASRWDQPDLDRVWHHAGGDPGGSWNG